MEITVSNGNRVTEQTGELPDGRYAIVGGNGSVVKIDVRDGKASIIDGDLPDGTWTVGAQYADLDPTGTRGTGAGVAAGAEATTPSTPDDGDVEPF